MEKFDVKKCFNIIKFYYFLLNFIYYLYLYYLNILKILKFNYKYNHLKNINGKNLYLS